MQSTPVKWPSLPSTCSLAGSPGDACLSGHPDATNATEGATRQRSRDASPLEAHTATPAFPLAPARGGGRQGGAATGKPGEAEVGGSPCLCLPPAHQGQHSSRVSLPTTRQGQEHSPACPLTLGSDAQHPLQTSPPLGTGHETAPLRRDRLARRQRRSSTRAEARLLDQHSAREGTVVK